MPADLSDFDANIKGSGQTLRVDTVMSELEDGKADALRQALSMPDTYPNRVIARTVTGWGHSVSATAVQNWRDRYLPVADDA